MRDNGKRNIRMAIYMRVAQAERLESARMAMAGQEQMLRSVVERGGHTVVASFRDFTSSASSRPGLCAAVEAVKNGQADALLVKDLGRISRDSFEAASIVQQLRAEGKKVFFADDLMQKGILAI